MFRKMKGFAKLAKLDAILMLAKLAGGFQGVDDIMRHWTLCIVAGIASFASAQQAQIFADAPASVTAGDAYSVGVYATISGYSAGAAVAGFGLTVEASGDQIAIAGVTEPEYGVFSVGTLTDRVDGSDLIRVVGGQLPNAFGLNPAVVTDSTVLLFSFEVQTGVNADGLSITYTPSISANGGLVVYASSTGAANSQALISGLVGVTTSVVSACTGDIADDFGFTAADGGGPDGVVDFGDFVALLGLIGPCSAGPGCTGDIADDFGFTAADGGGPDGVVDFGDFVALLGLIGPCS